MENNMARIIPTGEQCFLNLRKDNLFYVDKTKFIQDCWNRKDGVTLITRPRRFGKTLMLDTVRTFFSPEFFGYHRIFEGEFIEYVKSLKESGTIGCIGLSSHNPLIARKAVETGLVDVLMFSVNPCYDMQPPNEDVEQLWADEVYERSFHNLDPDRETLYELCAREGVGIDVMKVFAGGDLLKADLSMFGKALTPVQAMDYALSRPAVAAVMAGCKTVDEIRQALAWCDASDAEKDYAGVLSNVEKCTWSGHCMYCGHCAPCPKGLSVANVNKFLNLALAQGEVPETVREHYRLLPHHASECIACGACEKRCPFGVPVRKKMKQASRLFGL